MRSWGQRLSMQIFAAMITVCHAAAVLLPGCSRPETEENVETEEWFYRNLDSGLKPIYDAFRQAAEDPFGAEAVPILSGSGEPESYSVSQINTVYQGFLYDHPEMFWLTGTYDYHVTQTAGDEERADAVAVISFARSSEELEAMKAEFADAAGKFLSDIPEKAEDEEKAALIYRHLVEGAEYTEEALYDPSFAAQHTAYGAISERRAVCDGFALAYKYLLNRKGIRCLVIPGTSFEEPHTWNTAFWSGTWHESDPTWEVCSDVSGSLIYFDLTTREMNRDHQREESVIARLIPKTPD